MMAVINRNLFLHPDFQNECYKVVGVPAWQVIPHTLPSPRSGLIHLPDTNSTQAVQYVSEHTAVPLTTTAAHCCCCPHQPSLPPRPAATAVMQAAAGSMLHSRAVIQPFHSYPQQLQRCRCVQVQAGKGFGSVAKKGLGGILKNQDFWR